MAPTYLASLVKLSKREDFVLYIPRSNSSLADKAFSRCGPSLWNALPIEVRVINKFSTFKSKLKHYLFTFFGEFQQSLLKYRS